MVVPAPSIGPQNKAVAGRAGTVHFPFPALVRPQLEYSTLFWDPCFKENVEKLERSGLRATTMVQGLGCRYGVREVEGAGLVLPREEEPKG